MRILLTGAKGQLGHCFKDRLPENWALIATDSKTLNITDEAGVEGMVRGFEPDVIINAAAYTDVDRAESEQEKAFAVNALGPLHLARAAKAINACFIHISTDYVFDGTANCPIGEDVAPNPATIYGKSKLAGEVLALAAHDDTLVLRTSWVYSEYGRNFVGSLLKHAKNNSQINMVADQTGCPTYAGDVAQILIELLHQNTLRRGLYHYSSGLRMSRYEFARRILAEASQIDPAFKNVILNPVSSADFHSEARRPLFTVLDSRKILEHTQMRQPGSLYLPSIISQLLSQQASV